VVYSPRLGRLTHLRLQTLSLVPDALEAVVSSGIIGRLRVLDLQGCGLTDLSADILARADLRGLELLNLDGNRLSDRGLRVLREAGAALQAGNQNRLDEADFYYLEQGEDEPFDEDWE